MTERKKTSKTTVTTEETEESVNNVETEAKTVNPKLASKKGRTSWKPAQLLTVRDMTPGYKYRWVTKDPDNIRVKEEEGYVYVKQTTGLTGKHERPEGVDDGGPTTRDGIEYRESILMALPDDIKLLRDEYQAQKVREATHQSATGDLASEVGKLKIAGETPKLHGGLTFD